MRQADDVSIDAAQVLAFTTNFSGQHDNAWIISE